MPLESRKPLDLEMKVVIIAAAVFVALGIGLVYAGAYFYRDRARLVANGHKAKGIVAGYKRVESYDDQFLVPVVRFTTDSGQRVTFVGSTTAQPGLFRTECDKGDVVSVVYDPDQPENAVIDIFAEIWSAPLLIWGVGCGMVVIPAVTIWRHICSEASI